MAADIPGFAPFEGHAAPVCCVAFSPDGESFATGGDDGTVRIWDTATRRQISQLTGHTGKVYAVSWSSSGASLATAGNDGTARVWDIATGQQRELVTEDPGPVYAIAYSPDERTAAIAGSDGIVWLAAAVIGPWDRATGLVSTKLAGHTGPVHGVAYSPDGRTVATAGVDGTARLWAAATGKETAQLNPQAGPVSAVAYSPDGTILATAGLDGTACLWDAATGERQVQFTQTSGPVYAVAWSSDGTTLATAGDGTAGLWDAATGQQRLALTGHAGWVEGIAYRPDGTTVATAGEDGTIRLWDAATGQQTARLTGHTEPVLAVAYSPDGTRLATAGGDARACLWDAATGARVTEFVAGDTGQMNDVAYSPDGRTVATADMEGGARLWDTATGEQITDLGRDVGMEAVLSVAYGPDGATLATAGGDGTVRLWDTATGRHINQLARYNDPVFAVAYSPDGATLATASSDRLTRVWDIATGQLLLQLGEYPAWADTVAWSPDGATLATGSRDGTVRLWDAITGRPRLQLTAHSGSVFAVAWSPDGATLATGGNDSTVRLWDTFTGQQRLQLTGHTNAVFGVAYSPDGRTLASVGSDGTIRIWNPRNGAQVNGTGFGVPRAPARPLAGVRSDSPSPEDLLGIGGDVQTLAELIAATETSPPLAIALIGDWGAGKSSVMLQVEEQIGVLADRAKNNPGLSVFAENVRQVRFNAWHYSDDHLWAGLVSHLFQVLAAPPDPEPDAAASDQRAVAAERERLRADLAATQAASDTLAGELKAADAVPRPAGALGWLGSPWFAARVLLAAGRQGFRDLRASLVTVLGWIVLGAGAYAAWYFLGNWIAAVATAVAVAAPPVTLALRRLRAGHDAVLAWANKRHADLAARQQDYQRQIRSIQDQLLLVDAAARLARFLDERGAPTAYQQYQGLVGQVHDDLEQLSAALTQAHAQWAASGGFAAPPLERIVLYIDDLDRCPPRRVVEVLEAVHLMLALDLFVVVVAVDARWLIRSLEYHHHELFGGDQRDSEEVATPIDYLDKIFQIPYVLLPPAPSATAAYLRALLPTPVAAVRPGPALPEAGASDRGSPTPADEVATRDNAARDTALVSAGDVAGPPASRVAGDSVAGGRPAADVLEEFLRTGEPDPRAGGQLQPAGRASETVAVELRPQGLQLSPAEVAFMARLGGLLPTPRAAKRLVNIYRLVRIGIPDEELAGFTGDETGGPYQVVQVLLAMLVGHPEFTRKVFLALLDETNGGDLLTLVEKVGGAGGETRTFGMIKSELATVREAAPLAVDAGECRRWCPQLARFSFYTRDLAGPSPRLP